MIGTRWHAWDRGRHVRVRVLAIETCFVLVELEGQADPNGGDRRCWYPRAAFEPSSPNVYRLIEK